MMAELNYNNKKFVGKSNSGTGEVGELTIFHYRQTGEILTGRYQGGQITEGQLIGKVETDGQLKFYYQHINQDGELKAGSCYSTPELLPTGRIRLHESWQWFDGGKGTSIVEEIKE